MVEVIAAILFKDEQILLARRKFGKHLAGFWEFPGGKIEKDEDPDTCLMRELNEEFGIQSKVGEHFVDSDYKYDHIQIRLKAYFVEHVSGEFIPVDHDLIDWVKIKDLHTYKLAPADIPIVRKLQLENHIVVGNKRRGLPSLTPNS